MPVSEKEQQVLDWLAERSGVMLDLLAGLVNTDSPPGHKPGVDQVGALIRAFIEGQGIACEVSPRPDAGDMLRFAIPAAADDATGGRHLLLLGHRDTVFPVGEVTRRPFRIDGARAYGPGVADMKGGLVINAFVLAALARNNAAQVPVVALYTSDEEIASPASRDAIEADAANALACFNVEPGRPNGNIVTGRKGGVFLRFDIHGRAAHSGSNFTAGISAIEDAARKITQLHALTDLDAGITVNIGTIHGGQTVNTVAPHASGEIDLRYIAPADRDRMLASIRSIIEIPAVPGTRSELAIAGEFRPLVQSESGRTLLALYREAAQTLGRDIGEEFSGGCADSGLTSAKGVPTLCGLGPVGAHSHTPEEYIDTPTLLERAQFMALAAMRVTHAGFPQ